MTDGVPRGLRLDLSEIGVFLLDYNLLGKDLRPITKGNCQNSAPMGSDSAQQCKILFKKRFRG